MNKVVDVVDRANELDMFNEAKEVKFVVNETVFANVDVKDLIDDASDAAETIDEAYLIDEILVADDSEWRMTFELTTNWESLELLEWFGAACAPSESNVSINLKESL